MDRAEHAGKLFIISGPSGAGKGTICKRLVEDTKVEVSVSMTTRNPRPGEEEGVSYYFTTKEAFCKEIEAGGFLEHAEVYGNYYGTPKAKVIEKLQQGIDVVLEIDIQGALNVKTAYPDGIFIFILPPSMAELRKRITGRGSETEDAINLRLSQTLKEVSYIDKYDYCVVNGELEEAVSRVKAIVVAEHSRVSQNVYKLIEKYKEEV
ncbi:guanylate kinase [Anaerovoracaceae bacterium 41-7]|jgi:guanylate kinase|uniref:Guanylate kinase n=1 Tax=Anaerotruncus colihominis TaxID=169435 RepID=A0A845QGJ2_9FIRM|nr:MULTISPECIES: guanylate kinase [Clostridia]MCI9640283.1 guanylate kinase [Emergencia sp.]NBH60959.1 guanylate kinase [Anaerotruncus colihominis]NCE98482.1 guanylate kinase [Emergencia sp. 1XD21-10]NCF01614.1 guanylate kinase [Anaerotruncus sp. 80]